MTEGFLPTTPVRPAVESDQTRPFPRILLFDIDGTILNNVRRRDYRLRISRKLEDIFGTCGRIGKVDFAGKTDLGIYKEALECEGISEADVVRQIPVIEEAMRDILLAMSEAGPVFELCPGVRQLLEALSSDERFITSLLTGNFEKLAQLKLEMVGVWQYFRCRGAFGSDAFDRDRLPEVAAGRFRKLLNDDLAPDRFIVVGDTPRDIACARYFGARVLAVASGSFGIDALAALLPDAIIPQFSDTAAVVELLARI